MACSWRKIQSFKKGELGQNDRIMGRALIMYCYSGFDHLMPPNDLLGPGRSDL